MRPWQPTTHDIEHDVSIAHNTSTDGVVVWTIRSVLIGSASSRGLATSSGSRLPPIPLSLSHPRNSIGTSRRGENDMGVLRSVDRPCPLDRRFRQYGRHD